ncbi:hypothetical protein CVS40_12858 [Lucilia cuprina]|nr:hypothetical protein CVS40_12858 [Lucilia cuprina]
MTDYHTEAVSQYTFKKITYKRITQSAVNDKIEHILIEITNCNKKLLLGCVYRPNKNICYDNFLELLESLTIQYADVIIASDFNLNTLVNSGLKNSLMSIGLFIVNNQNPTHFTATNASLLDIFTVTNMENVLLFDQ